MKERAKTVEENRKEKQPRDLKFIVGMILFVAVFAVITLGFWSEVGKQAELVKKEEARQEAEAINAIYVEHGELLKKGYFVDMDSQTVFTADIPKEGIYNQKGSLNSSDVLENGDMVKIYGDGRMTRSLPAVYENVTKMKRQGRATLEELQPYVEIVESILQGGAGIG